VIVTIQPSTVSGNIVAPASKSSMQRACALALLNTGETTLLNPGNSNDDMAALEIIEKSGAIIFREEDGTLRIKGANSPLFIDGGVLDCGESGLGIRMFTPIAALSSAEVTITGSGSLLQRPMHFFDEIFPQLRISVHSNNGYLPIKIKGPLVPTDITIDSSLSSQFLTGLLIAFGKAATGPVTINVTNLKSKPYIDLTVQMMKQFGCEVENNNYESFTIKPTTQLPGKPKVYTVEGDWSGAAFLLVAGAIAGGITVNGLELSSAQADKAILQALMDSGVNISIEEKQIVINTPLNAMLKPFHFNATDCPDLFPPLVSLAAYCSGTTIIEGVSRLMHKESNRALTLQEEFLKMGIEIILQDDLMMIKGGTGLNGVRVSSRHDHRIAMACAVAALRADGETIIEHADAVNKSYPGFFEDLKLLGADVSLPVNQ
jgi:3-phosphoshikimate 1-carboxyvinyltransferase